MALRPEPGLVRLCRAGARCWTSTSGEPKRIAILEYEPRGTAQPPELHGGRLLQMAQRYVQGEQTLCAVVNRRLLLVFGPEQKALEVLKQFQQAAESFYEVTLSGGLSSLSRGAEDIRRCYNEAKIAARAAAKKPHHFGVQRHLPGFCAAEPGAQGESGCVPGHF